ncbi:MAG: Response regulator receiver protein [Parcubacteria group bacterium GW2011_GWA1_36_12]|nr:MAG: Response regulator receiver protein [Parcubacteria group bacterium GW2011_GWA1_36_12]
MKKVLIVEDDEVFAKILSDDLSKAGFSVTRTVDAMQGQQAVSSLKPDLIVLDLMLPAGNGVELLKNLRVSVQTQGIPIIIATSYKDEEVKKEVEAVGVQGYFHKPFQSSDLIKEINRILT